MTRITCSARTTYDSVSAARLVLRKDGCHFTSVAWGAGKTHGIRTRTPTAGAQPGPAAAARSGRVHLVPERRRRGALRLLPGPAAGRRFVPAPGRGLPRTLPWRPRRPGRLRAALRPALRRLRPPRRRHRTSRRDHLLAAAVRRRCGPGRAVRRAFRPRGRAPSGCAVREPPRLALSGSRASPTPALIRTPALPRMPAPRRTPQRTAVVLLLLRPRPFPPPSPGTTTRCGPGCCVIR